MALILKWLALALSIMFVGWIIPGITISSFVTALIASAVIALVNLVIKPILVFLTLPINILTLGLFILVINALLFMFVAYLVPGVEIDGFWSAFWGAVILSILSIGISWLWWPWERGRAFKKPALFLCFIFKTLFDIVFL